jgi:hypothetical protein
MAQEVFMGFFDDLMKDTVPKLKALCGKKRSTAPLSYQPIKNLKSGDRLRWKKGQSSCRFPQEGEVVEVHQVITPEVRSRMTIPGENGNHACDMPDFTVLFVDENDGKIEEFPFDSRRFERAK